MKSIFQEAARVHLNEILLLLCALDRQLINSSRMKRLRKSYHRFLQDCEKKRNFQTNIKASLWELGMSMDEAIHLRFPTSK